VNLFDAIFSQEGLSTTAALYEGRQITYGELREQTLRIAQALAPLGIAPGDRVALLLNDSPEFIAAFISICSSGAIAVPINMGLRLDEQQLILNDCGARVALVESYLTDSLASEARERLPHLRDLVVITRNGEEEFTAETQEKQEPSREGLENEPLRKCTLKDLINETASRRGPKWGSAGSPAEHLGWGARPAELLIAPPSFAQPTRDEPAFILYTSGSTGEPKGAMHRQADIFYTNETYCRQVLQLKPGDRIFSSSRLPFAYGLGNSFTFPLLNHATTILCREKPTAEVISRVFTEYLPTIFFGVPVIYSLLLDHHKRVSRLDCSSLRFCVSAGEALPAQLGEEWQETFGVEVLDGIGSTETLHMFMSNHSQEVRYGSSGKVLEGYEARLLDQAGNPVARGEIGNLWVKGSSAAIGYWRRPDVTAQTFVDGWVRTGDLYVRDQDGYWFHMGRSDDCFKSSGQWVSPVEVEGLLLRNPNVSRSAVVEDFDEAGLPCACAFVVCKDVESDVHRIEAELRQLTRSVLPRFKQPRRYFFVEDLPYTATGKIQRFKLRERLRQRSAVR
jgi:benzoate-CoA ligase family protein